MVVTWWWWWHCGGMVVVAWFVWVKDDEWDMSVSWFVSGEGLSGEGVRV